MGYEDGKCEIWKITNENKLVFENEITKLNKSINDIIIASEKITILANSDHREATIIKGENEQIKKQSIIYICAKLDLIAMIKSNLIF